MQAGRHSNWAKHRINGCLIAICEVRPKSTALEAIPIKPVDRTADQNFGFDFIFILSYIFVSTNKTNNRNVKLQVVYIKKKKNGESPLGNQKWLSIYLYCSML